MEGYPLNDTTYTYVNDPVNEYMTYDAGSRMIEQLNYNTPSDIKDITDSGDSPVPKNIVSQLGNELYMNLQGSFTGTLDIPTVEELNAHDQKETEKEAKQEDKQEDKQETNEIRDHSLKIRKFMDCWEDMIQSYHQIHERVCDIEEALKASCDKTQKSLTTVRKFSSFLQTLEDKEHEELQMMMVILSEKLKNSDTTKELKDKYQKELYILQMYLHFFIKTVNNGNVGNTCSLCLIRPVDSFLNPCGHTGCSECIERMKHLTDTHEFNCPLCRKIISSTHQLYFN